MTATPKTAPTELLIAKLSLALTEACCSGSARKRILADRTHAATHIASRMLSPIVPPGLYEWLMRAQIRESPRGYARRVVRCLVARCASAGVRLPLSAVAAEGVGMRDGHGSGARRSRSATSLVSTIERIIDRKSDAHPDA